MTMDANNLIWIDLEMTGLDPVRDAIIEIATVITDKNLNILDNGPVLAIYQSDAVLAGMDEWNQTHHRQSGLIDRVKHSAISVADAEQQTLTFLRKWLPANVSPMCGNSICQDRRFLHRLMPELESFFHYRNLDVSTVKELAARWSPQLMDGFKKKSAHQALEDIVESIEELRYYREHFFKC
jgi:oligoribonuclease